MHFSKGPNFKGLRCFYHYPFNICAFPFFLWISMGYLMINYSRWLLINMMQQITYGLELNMSNGIRLCPHLCWWWSLMGIVPSLEILLVQSHSLVHYGSFSQHPECNRKGSRTDSKNSIDQTVWSSPSWGNVNLLCLPQFYCQLPIRLTMSINSVVLLDKFPMTWESHQFNIMTILMKLW